MVKKSKLRRFTFSDGVIHAAVLAFSLICVLPLLLVVIVSFTDESAILRNGYSFFPQIWSTDAYTTIWRNNTALLRSYGVSVLVTSAGTLIAILITSMAGYGLANKHVKYRNAIAFVFFITIIFRAGLVPWYIICRNLGLRDNIFSLIVPSLMFNVFDLFLVRNYMSSIPDSFMESAKLDGANDWTIATRIYFPLCVPVIAAVTLFYGLNYWNDWRNAIMLVDNKNLYPVQYLLFKLQSDMQMLAELQDYAAFTPGIVQPTESIKMATCIITIGPIVLLYPFLQRFFVKGLVIGGVKG